jgi:hypothetical protein
MSVDFWNTIKAKQAESAYADMDDDQKAAAINALTITIRRPANIVDITTYLRTEGAWGAIVVAASTNPAAAAAVDYNNDLRASTLDLDLPIVQTMLDGLTGASPALLTTDQRAAIMAMGDVVIPYLTSIEAPMTRLFGDDVAFSRSVG